MEENKRLKVTIEKYRAENQGQQAEYSSLKAEMNSLSQRLNDLESQSFAAKSTIDRLRNESEQIKVDLTYARATAQN